MKVKVILLAVALFITLFAGCSKTQQQTTPPGTTTPGTTTPGTGTTDVVTTASIVNTPEAFEKAIGKDGTWIIAVLNDLTIDKDLVLEGDFKNTKNPPVSQRKIALYAQDENRNVTASYTLTAPKLTILSPDAEITNGTFKGDVYVSAKNFKLKGSTVDGNVYFTTDEAQSTFTMDDKSKITGVKELKK